jgi:phospholipid/cholesterol/gamma-HCH transport system substrate-binding protein
MKTETGSKVKLGLWILIGIALFSTGIYFVGKSKNMFDTTFRITGMFNNIGGLQVGNNVRFAGIDVGTVDNITIISDTVVKVELIIEERLQKFIRKDSKAVIGSEGLMGNKVVTITAGDQNGPIIADDAIIQTIKPIDTDQILKDVKSTIENLKGISSDIGIIMNNVRSGKGTLGGLIMDSVFSRNIKETLINLNKGTSGIESTMNNIKKGTEGFKENMDAVKSNFLLRGYFKKKEKEKEKGKLSVKDSLMNVIGKDSLDNMDRKTRRKVKQMIKEQEKEIKKAKTETK